MVVERWMWHIVCLGSNWRLDHLGWLILDGGFCPFDVTVNSCYCLYHVTLSSSDLWIWIHLIQIFDQLTFLLQTELILRDCHRNLTVETLKEKACMHGTKPGLMNVNIWIVCWGMWGVSWHLSYPQHLSLEHGASCCWWWSCMLWFHLLRVLPKLNQQWAIFILWLQHMGWQCGQKKPSRWAIERLIWGTKAY